MNLIKNFICLIIILFAFPAMSEIYKYVDENGNVHFTDDYSNVPVEQRTVVTVSEEYQNNTNEEQVAETGTISETDEGLTDESADEIHDLSGEIENNEESDFSEDIADSDQDAKPDQDRGEDGELPASAAGKKTEKDLAAIRSQLEMMKKEIDKEYIALVKEKEQLAKEAESLKNREEILKHNKRVEILNKKAAAYVEKGKIYEARVDAYNERISQQNAKARKKSETQ